MKTRMKKKNLFIFMHERSPVQARRWHGYSWACFYPARINDADWDTPKNQDVKKVVS